jgi:simple sugar transport system permease protein
MAVEIFAATSGLNGSVVVRSAVAAIVAGTPLVLGAVGEIHAERSGVMNLGVEGMMLLGALFGIIGTIAGGSPWVGLLAAMAGGALLASIFAFLSVSLRVNQVVSGLALVIVGTGLSSYLGKVPDPALTGRGAVASFNPIFHGGPAKLPLLGPLFFGHDPVVYLSWLIVAGASYYLYRTRAGLAVRAVGEDPATADAAGIRVGLIRYVHVIIGGALAGMGGGYLSIAITGIWQDQITAGAGWIAFALVSFSGWRPWRALLAAYVFGALTSLNFTLQAIGIKIPSDLLAMLPFVMTILVLMVVSATSSRSRALQAPAALGTPYVRESR